jgi:hypothetical protein
MIRRAVATPFRQSGFLRWACLGGLAYVVLTIVGMFLMLNGLPGGDAAPSKVIAYYQDSGHRTRIGIGWLVIVIGVFFLFWFVAGLRVSVQEGILTMSDDTYRHAVDPMLVHAGNDVVYVVHSAGGAAIGAAIIAVSIAAIGARALPAFVGWLSVAAGIVAIFSIFFIPWIVIALWLAIASILVTRALGRLSAGAAPAAGG